jgi:hypothetical protein
MPPLMYTTIPQSGFVSGNLDLTKHALAAIRVPAITSCDLAVQGNIDQTSAGFHRLLETRTPTSGDMRFATGVGSRQIPWPPNVPTPAWARLETLVAQADVRTLTILTESR